MAITVANRNNIPEFRGRIPENAMDDYDRYINKETSEDTILCLFGKDLQTGLIMTRLVVAQEGRWVEAPWKRYSR